jgi:catechol 2,3-dioxygenase-like lactoylglutathione lyase family enzyme
MSTDSDPRYPEFHFDCVFHYVSHMDLTIRFYRDVLGFKLISRDVVARFEIDGVLCELVPAPAKENLHAKGNARLCLRVENVEQALNELRTKGVRTGPAVVKGAGVLGSFEDPEGNEICLWQYHSKL